MNTRLALLVLVLASAGCTIPRPYEPPSPSPTTPQPGSVETQPAPQPPPPEEPQPLPAPVIRQPTLSAASRALVTQAQAQSASKNFAVAAGSIERALRIEPDNALLWIELG